MHSVLYRGRLKSQSQLARELRISEGTLLLWRLRGVLNEYRIDKHLAAREELAERRAMAAAHGVPMSVVKMREQRGWEPVRAATTPVMRRASG